MYQEALVEVTYSGKLRKDQAAVSSSLMEAWRLAPSTIVAINVGHLTVQASARPLQSPQPKIILSKQLYSRLSIPKPCKLYAYYQEQAIRLGPVVGVVLNSSKFEGISNHFLRSHTSKYPMLLYKFNPAAIGWKSYKVRGTFLVRKGKSLKWRKAAAPFPNVIYNQIKSRKIYQTALYKRFFKYLRKAGSTIFNHNYFDKGDMYAFISNDTQLKAYLPLSYISPSADQIEELLAMTPSVFLKPLKGSGGQGIYKISRTTGETPYYCEAVFGNTQIRKSYATLSLLLQNHVQKLSSYLVQQGVELMRYGPDFFDLRIQLNKDGKNEWVVTAIGANINHPSKITTHGGWIKTGSYVLNEVFQQQAAGIEEKIAALSMRIGYVLEKGYGHELGDLGIDLGVDRDGRVWIFEANSAPGRHIFKHNLLKPQHLVSDQTMMDYCHYLFRKQNNKYFSENEKVIS
ncbi:YheC/YheD family protein [Paenibacillus glycanilyticus]|uniref:YheC/YheD family endospore coat-associated protein n=1 Tax=Paenibacillus glycanilyticus TaxID=126569 RepID=UPI00204082AE|nr:YheC/YheD family protein [Paenibacillus glycanilyticus]MCM3628637.1 YheC/YheD family protein [Paenibacillus glycanilyticus]